MGDWLNKLKQTHIMEDYAKKKVELYEMSWIYF